MDTERIDGGELRVLRQSSQHPRTRARNLRRIKAERSSTAGCTSRCALTSTACTPNGTETTSPRDFETDGTQRGG